MGMGLSCRKNAFFQAPIKLAQPFPAPELRANNFKDARIFLIVVFDRRDVKNLTMYEGQYSALRAEARAAFDAIEDWMADVFGNNRETTCQ